MRFETNYLKFVDNIQKKETDFYDEYFWNKVKNLDDNFYTIITFSTENLTYRYANKPYIIKISSFDYVPYKPTSAKKTFDILREIYGVNINNDKKFLTEEFIKDQFQRKKNYNWIKIKQEFNAKYVIVPYEWNLDLKEILSNKKFKVYEI